MVIKLADELAAGAIIVGSRNPNIQTHLLGSGLPALCAMPMSLFLLFVNGMKAR